MSFFEEKLDGQIIYEGKILKLNVDSVILPDGKTAKREYINHSGGAAVLYVENGKVLLVKQFRYAYGKEIYEIPAGKLEKGEDPVLAAKRELEEEPGYVAKSLTELFKLYPTPGYSDEIIYVYLAENCLNGSINPDEDEFVECELIELEKVCKMIESGEICDAKTVAAVYKYLSDYSRRQSNL